MTLTTTAKVKTAIGGITGPAKDALIDDLVAAADDLIDNLTDRKLQSDTYTHQFDGNGRPYFLAKEWPVTAITSIKFAADWSFDAVSAEDADDYRIDDRGQRRIYFRIGIPEGLQNVQMVYTAGYATIPDDLSQLATFICTKWFREHTQKGQALTTTNEPGGSSFAFRETALPPLYRKIVEHYARRGV